MNDRTLMEIEKARDILLSHISVSDEYEAMRPSRAYGRICARDVYSPINVPSFPRSAMDGYAVRAEDIRECPVTLNVAGELLAGDCTDTACAPGTAVRVMTGAYIPDGYDCVVKQEDTDYGEKTVQIYSPVKQYMNYCPVGEEFSEGELLIKKGTRIGRIEEFLLHSAGMTEVNVITRPLVSVYSTGSELILPGNKLRKGQIYNGLESLLCASVRDLGLNIADCDNCPDDKESIAESIRIGLTCSDIIITTGGVSVGKKDLLPEVMKDMGAEILFHGTAIQPGTPTMASVLDGKVILSLSGNPFAALANFDYYFPYIAAKITGSDSFLTEEKTAVLADEYTKAGKMRRFVRARYEDGKVYLPTDRHFSSVVGNLTECNCYMDVPAQTPLNVGDTVKIRMMKL
ncbi:MAG: molybdopterin molybdotransferase MoeA [Oscillospiraceae bacterium]|nr:molybdopterin molybdotransferase MoeA [Oscillospiraceae bacterium]